MESCYLFSRAMIFLAFCGPLQLRSTWSTSAVIISSGNSAAGRDGRTVRGPKASQHQRQAAQATFHSFSEVTNPPQNSKPDASFPPRADGLPSDVLGVREHHFQGPPHFTSEQTNRGFDEETKQPRMKQGIVSHSIVTTSVESSTGSQMTHTTHDHRLQWQMSEFVGKTQEIPEDEIAHLFNGTLQVMKEREDSHEAIWHTETLNVRNRDKFRCSNCSCYFSSSKLHANCSSSHLEAIPRLLPRDVYFIDMSRNLLSVFNTSHLQMYPKLTLLDLSVNKISKIENNLTQDVTLPLMYLAMDFNRLKTLGISIFSSMPNLIILKLGHNTVSAIRNSTFLGLHNLRNLNLSYCSLEHIETGVFDDLKRLTILDLSHNKDLTYYAQRFPPRLLQNLKQLTHLFIQGNSAGSIEYPNTALNHLSNLRLLNIDALNTELGPQLKDLKYLNTLLLGTDRGICNIRNLTKVFFSSMQYLTHLEMRSCRLRRIDPDSFQGVKNLQTFKLKYMGSFSLDQAFQALISFQNMSLKELSLIHLIQHQRAPCVYLRADQATYLRNLSLQKLDLSNNNIALMESGFIESLPRTLEEFYLSHNYFNIKTFSLKNLASLSKLRYLDVSFQNFVPHLEIPNTPQYDFTGSSYLVDASNYSASPKENMFSFSESDLQNDFRSNKRQQSDWYRSDRLPLEPNHSVVILPNLKQIKASVFSMFGYVVLHTRGKSLLERLDFSDSYLTQWGSGRLPSYVREINLGSNYCLNLRQKFFPENNSLEVLNIAQNFLGPTFASDVKGDIFSRLNRTTYLDISRNSVFTLRRNFFRGLTNLRALILRDNKLGALNFSLVTMKYLNHIDASENSISWINKQTQMDMDRIASDHQLDLNLMKNSLPCTCEGIQVMQWLATTKVHLLNKEYLTCYLEDGSVETIGNFDKRVKILQRRCVSTSVFISIGVAGSLMFVFIVASGFIYSNRWKLRYLKNILIAKKFGFKPKTGENGCRKFDAFIVYAEEDRDFVLKTLVRELENNRGHKVCIIDREFLAGTNIIANITSAVQLSTVTVPVVTPDFADGEFCEYAVNMAVYETVFARPSVLHVLLCHSVSEHDLSRDLLKVLKENRYTTIPPSDMREQAEIEQNMWDELSRAIGHINGLDIRTRLQTAP